jgi:hypothetical protein
LRELGFVLARMDTVDRTHINARCILRVDARIRDDERHDPVSNDEMGLGQPSGLAGLYRQGLCNDDARSYGSLSGRSRDRL